MKRKEPIRVLTRDRARGELVKNVEICGNLTGMVEICGEICGNLLGIVNKWCKIVLKNVEIGRIVFFEIWLKFVEMCHKLQ